MFDAIINALSLVLTWFGRIFVTVFQATWDVTIDLIIAVFDLLFSATGVLISSAPASQFLIQYSLQSPVDQVGSGILYFVSVFNIPQDLTMFGVGIVFRLFVHRFFTLGQW